METKQLFTSRFTLVAALALSAVSLPRCAFAQGTAFTYQGRLTDGANAAKGIYDVRFAIYDAANPPDNLVAGPLTNSATSVSNGAFTVTLDFGATVFDGRARWLDIAVRTNGAGAFSALTPRQALTPAPYAMMAGAASNVLGTVPLAQLPASVVTNGAGGVSITGTFTGNGGGLTNLAGVALLNANQTFTGTNTLTQPVILSSLAPTVRMMGWSSTATLDLSSYDPGTNPPSARIQAKDNNWSSDVDFYTKQPGGNVNPLVSRLHLGANGNVGIGTNNPVAPLEVAGNARFDANVTVAGILTGNGAGLTNLNAGNVTGGTLSLAQLPAGVVTNGASGVNITGTFSGNASGCTNVNASHLTGGLTVLETPVPVGHINNTSLGIAVDVALSGNICYLAGDEDGLLVYDVTNPAKPAKVGHVNDSAGATEGVTVSGNYLYVAKDVGLHIYSITNPAAPVRISTVNVGTVWSVTVSGKYCYMASDTSGLRIYDISNPASPLSVGSTGGLIGPVLQTDVAGGVCYLACSSGGLVLVNVSNPTNPIPFGSISGLGSIYTVKVAGNYCYLGGANGLFAYDVSNPVHPVALGHVGGVKPCDLSVAGSLCYVAGDDDGLRVYDVSTPSKPVTAGHVDNGAYAVGVAVAGDYCYIANHTDGLRIYRGVSVRP